MPCPFHHLNLQRSHPFYNKPNLDPLPSESNPKSVCQENCWLSISPMLYSSNSTVRISSLVRCFAPISNRSAYLFHVVVAIHSVSETSFPRLSSLWFSKSSILFPCSNYNRKNMFSFISAIHPSLLFCTGLQQFLSMSMPRQSLHQTPNCPCSASYFLSTNSTYSKSNPSFYLGNQISNSCSASCSRSASLAHRSTLGSRSETSAWMSSPSQLLC